MRCASCNELLSSRESSRKSPITGDYFDLCDNCFSFIQDDVEAVENPIAPNEEEE